MNLPGTILAALFDEAVRSNDAKTCGLLFGSKSTTVTSTFSDDAEESNSVETKIVHVTHFCRFQNIIKLWENVVRHPPHDVVGILVIRRDNLQTPSLRDVATASKVAGLLQLEEIFVLVANVPSLSSNLSWIFSMAQKLFCLKYSSRWLLSTRS